MKWIKIASGVTLFSNGGSTKAWPLAVQDWGLSVKDVMYVIFVTNKTPNAKVGAEHREGPNADANFFTLYGNVIPVNAPGNTPINIKGTTNSATNGPLLPFFTPTVLVGDAGAVESITCDVYVGGKAI